MRSNFLFAAAALLAATPAVGAVSVIGNTAARSCYLAAESRSAPSLGLVQFCDEALHREALTDDELVATYVNRGILKARLGNLNAAVSDYDAALSRIPTSPKPISTRASRSSAFPSRESRPSPSSIQRSPRRPEGPSSLITAGPSPTSWPAG